MRKVNLTRDAVNMMIGSRVREVRRRRKMTMADVALSYGGEASDQGDYERGERSVPIVRLLQMSVVLHVAPGIWFLGDDAFNDLLDKSVRGQVDRRLSDKIIGQLCRDLLAEEVDNGGQELQEQTASIQA